MLEEALGQREPKEVVFMVYSPRQGCSGDLLLDDPPSRSGRLRGAYSRRNFLKQA
jgi:hypothetical protein